MLCKADEAGTDFLSTFFTFDLNFRNFKDWITFRSDIFLDGSLSRDLSDFTANPLNRVRDLNCRSFFIFLSSLPLIFGTFVSESTAVLCCTEPGTAFKNTLTREHFAITLLWTINALVWFLQGQKTFPHYHSCQIFCHTKNIAWSLISVHCLPKEVHWRFFVSQKIGTILKSELVQTTPVNSTAPHHFRGKKSKPQCS